MSMSQNNYCWPRKSRLKVPQVKNALMAHRGVLVQAANALGVHRITLFNFLQKHPELQEVRNNCLQIILDRAENNFWLAVEGGDLYASRFVLERQGRDRGWAPSPVVMNQNMTFPFLSIVRIPAGTVDQYTKLIEHDPDPVIEQD
jgi:hypothetical protein